MGKSRKLKINNSALDNKPPTIKYVKRARMWVTTKFENGKQIQTWTIEKPSGENNV